MGKIANFFSKSTSIIIGVLFLVVGLIFFFVYDPAAYDSQGTGTITEITEHYEMVGEEEELMHDVYIDYTAGGKTFEHAEYFEYDSGMKVGDTVEFFYMSSDPSQIAGSSKDKAPYIGLVFAAIGLVMLVITILKIIRRKPM